MTSNSLSAAWWPSQRKKPSMGRTTAMMKIRMPLSWLRKHARPPMPRLIFLSSMMTVTDMSTMYSCSSQERMKPTIPMQMLTAYGPMLIISPETASNSFWTTKESIPTLARRSWCASTKAGNIQWPRSAPSAMNIPIPSAFLTITIPIMKGAEASLTAYGARSASWTAGTIITTGIALPTTTQSTDTSSEWASPSFSHQGPIPSSQSIRMASSILSLQITRRSISFWNAVHPKNGTGISAGAASLSTT